MSRERVRLSLVLAALLASPTLAQEPRPTLDRQWLAGTWKLDKSGPPEDRKNWDRILQPGNPPTPCVETKPRNPAGSTGAQPAEPCGMPTFRPSDPEPARMLSLKCFGEDLIMASDTLVIGVEPDAIMLDDDFREPTRYAATKDTTIRVATEFKTGMMPKCAVKSFDVRVKTSWNGNAMVQELMTRDLMEIVKVTRTFMPADGGRQMLLVIKVLEPKLKDPVKDIQRLYTKANW